jgi:hypothetical protein
MTMRGLVATVMLGAVVNAQTMVLAQQMGQQPDKTYTLDIKTNIVLTNVVVRDKKTGAVVKDLKPGDFQITEDKKPQKISTFDYQNVDEAAGKVQRYRHDGARAWHYGVDRWHVRRHHKLQCRRF